LMDVFNPLRDELAPIARSKGISFRLLHSDLAVISDPGYLRRIVQNLLTNALRYTNSGRVLAGVRRVGQFARIEIWDTGIGIAEVDQQSIFLEFNQVTPGAANPGLGLGLAIVERACKGLGHALDLWSEPGTGSCFSVMVPICAQVDLVDKPNAADMPKAAPDLSGLLIMLVENNQSVASAMCQLIESFGCEVLHAQNAHEALNTISEIDLVPDAFLLDYQLGEGPNGVELHELISQKFGHVPTSIVSADRRTELRSQCRRLDIKLLAKPVDAQKVYGFLKDCARSTDG